MFTRVLMKYLETRDKEMHAKAKAQIKECYEKNKNGDPQFKSLTKSMKSRLRSTVGEIYWKKAQDYLQHFFKQKQQKKLEEQAQMAGGGGGSGQQQQQQVVLPPANVVRTMPVPQQSHPMTQSQVAAAKKIPMSSVPMPIPVVAGAEAAALKMKAELQNKGGQVTKVMTEQEKRDKRNAENRARRAKKKEQDAKSAKGKALGGITLPKTTLAASGITTPMMTTPATGGSSVSSTTPGNSASKSKVDMKTVGKKKVVKRLSTSSLVKKKTTQRLMEMIDHAVLVDAKSLPNMLSKENMTDFNLDDEQRLLLYGEKDQRGNVKKITDAAALALGGKDVDSALKEVGVPPLPWKLPDAYARWGEKNVVSTRVAWAKVRLPESEMQRAEKEQQDAEKARSGAPMTVSSSTDVPSAIIRSEPPNVQDDRTNHVWFNEARAAQDPTLALISEATELYLKSAIEKAIGKARARQNLDGVRLWHTLQSHQLDPKKIGENPPALLRLGCDVRRQVALAEGNAAKTYQRMEEAISRQNDTYHSTNSHDPETMLVEATSMSNLSRKPQLKSAVETADAYAKRKFEVYGGKDSKEPPFGRVPKMAKVIASDLAVGPMGNVGSTLESRRKRFMAGVFL